MVIGYPSGVVFAFSTSTPSTRRCRKLRGCQRAGAAEDDSLIKLAEEELNKIGLLNSQKILNGHVHRVPKCYPVYHKNYKNELDPVIEYLKTL